MIMRRGRFNVIPKKSECLSTRLVEPLAGGCVGVASDVPANRFTLDDGSAGLLVPGQNPEELAAAIERLLVDAEQREKFHQRALERAQYFSAERMASDYINFYAHLVKYPEYKNFHRAAPRQLRFPPTTTH